MFLQALPAATALIFSLNETILTFQKTGLSKRQQWHLAMLLTGIVSNGTINLTRISFACFGSVSLAVFSAFIHRSSIPWVKIQFAAFLHILKNFDIKKIHLQIDDTDLGRSKRVRALFGVFRTIHKPTNGFQNAQNLVLLTACAFGVSFPVVFSFYQPDPALTKWHKEQKASALKKKKTGKGLKVGPKPKRSKNYPTRNQIAARLLVKVQKWLSIVENTIGVKIKVISISADAAYLDPILSKKVKKIFPGSQFISQIKGNQMVRNKNGQFVAAKTYFSNLGKPIASTAKLRDKEKCFEYHSARLHVKSHGRILHIIALRYEGEEEYRYLAASNLSWRTIDIIRSYSLRWLIEVGIQDCKGYCGLGRRACLQGVKGAYVSVFLSLLVDCLLLAHPDQLDLHQTGQQLYTAGSVVERLRCETNITTIKSILNSPNPKERLSQLAETLANQVENASRKSRKHIRDESIFDVGPSPQLERKFGT